MTAMLWMVWLVSVNGHAPGSTRMLAVFPAVEGEARAAVRSCEDVAARLTQSYEGAAGFFCKEVAQ